MAIPIGDYPYNGGKMGDPEASGLDVEAGDSGNLTVTREGNTFTVDSNTDGTASGVHSSVGGTDTLAQGDNSNAHGEGVVAKGKEQNAFGRYNEVDNSDQFAEVVGGGTSGERKNIRTLDWEGNERVSGEVYPNGGSTSYGAMIENAKAFRVKFTVDDVSNPTTVSMDCTPQQLVSAFSNGKPVIAELIVTGFGTYCLADDIQFSALTWPIIFTFKIGSGELYVNVQSSGQLSVAKGRAYLRGTEVGSSTSNVLVDDGTLTYLKISEYIASTNVDPAVDWNGLRYRFQGAKTTGTSAEYWFGVSQSLGSGGEPTYIFQRVYKNDGTISSWSKAI